MADIPTTNSSVINDELFSLYRQRPLIFSPMVHSTTTMLAIYEGIKFREEEFARQLGAVDQTLHPNIIGYASNYGVWPIPTVKQVEPAKTRGRKSAPKRVKPKKANGSSGECFNSQVLVLVRGYLERNNPITNQPEVLYPRYKVKVFQNGSVTIPGVLQYDMSDIDEPLMDLGRYLEQYMPNIKYIESKRTMSNFKFTVKGQQLIDLIKLETKVRRQVSMFLRFNQTWLAQQLVKYQGGWRSIANRDQPHQSNSQTAQATLIIEAMQQCKNRVNMRCTPEIFNYYYNQLPMIARDNYMYNLVCYSNLTGKLLDKLAELYMRPHIAKMFLALSKSNMLLPPSSDEERQPALLLCMRTPNPTNADRETKIKIFPAQKPPQKIDIDGANNYQEAEYIYYWFSDYLQSEAGLLYTPYEYPADDSEFSCSDDDNDDPDYMSDNTVEIHNDSIMDALIDDLAAVVLGDDDVAMHELINDLASSDTDDDSD